jgi:mannose-6-phosphate isomerase-like protein (cupin superfamily)
VELLTERTVDTPPAKDRHEVLMVQDGHWRVIAGNQAVTLAPGDTLAIPPGTDRTLAPAMTGRATLYRVVNTDDPAGATQLQ